MESLRQFTNGTLVPSLLSVPRFAQRAGNFAFFYLPEQFDSLIGKARNGGSIIAEPTTSGTSNSTAIFTLGQFVQETMASATADPTTVAGTGTESTSFFTLTNIRNLGGIFSYLMSKWALATLTIAVVLNRTQFYASSRVPLTLRWYLRLALYILPIASFLLQIQWILQTIRCQTSPRWSAMQYGDHDKLLPIDYAGEGGRLYRISNALVFWEDELSSCAAMNMLPQDGNVIRPDGSLGLLWPLFLSLGFSQFVEVLSCALQGRTPMPETGMTIFEHSLAFAEAEATITRPLLFHSAKAASKTATDTTTGENVIRIARSTLMQAANVPPEVLVISLISSMSHLSSNVLAVAGLRTKYRLVNTGVWGLSYMAVFLWSFARAVSGASEVSMENGILRFPTVCIVGFIPHLLIFVGITGCAVIYAIALVLTAAALPSSDDTPRPFLGRISSRLTAAYTNLQVNVYLGATPSIRINWQEDFYTALLKIGFTIMTAASEAVYLNEGTKVAVSPLTWLEEKRIRELITERKGLRKTMESIPNELIEDSIADGVIAENLSLALGPRVSGYSRERKTKGRSGSSDGTRHLGREHGVGFIQRRSRWVLAFQFMKGIAWLVAGLTARLSLSLLEVFRIPLRPRWLTELVGQDRASGGPKTSRSSSKREPETLHFWVLQPDGSLALPNDEHVDVEVETRERLRLQPPGFDDQVEHLERTLNQHLYDWWKSGGWWGDVDSSGDYATAENEDDDLTSMISTSDAGELNWEELSDEDDGRRTPTQRNPFPFTREPSLQQDDLFDPTRLASLLDPQTPAQQEEARLLARHLRSDKILTRSQHRKAIQQERAKVIATTTHFPLARTSDEEEQALEQFLLERRAHQATFRAKITGEGDSWSAGAEGMGSTGPQCVVCQTSPRTILMWPCSCLSLCDDCRVGLATRNFTQCVCCRTTVVAYSRLYVP